MCLGKRATNDMTRRVMIKPCGVLRCRHLIPALNAWATRAFYTTPCPIVRQFSWHGCIDDLTTERSFDLHLTESLMCLAYLLTYHPWVLKDKAPGGVRSTGAGIK